MARLADGGAVGREGGARRAGRRAAGGRAAGGPRAGERAGGASRGGGGGCGAAAIGGMGYYGVSPGQHRQLTLQIKAYKPCFSGRRLHQRLPCLEAAPAL